MSVATYAAAQILRALPRTSVSRAVGRICDAHLPPKLLSAVVHTYVRAYRVNLEECVAAENGYGSFDAFFTRALRSGERRQTFHEEDVVSPADGRIESRGPIDGIGKLQIKGRPYDVTELVGDALDAARYQGGQFAVVYLSPRDYHRVHSPVSGKIVQVRSLPGDLFPVNAIGERHVPSLFSRNRRVAIVIDTPKGHRVTVVMVGAIIVGRITVTIIPGQDVPLGTHHVDPPRAVRHGEEIGMFHLGSTAIVLVEPGQTFARAVGPVRLGDSLLEDA